MFDVEFHIFVTMAKRASQRKISTTKLNSPPSKTRDIKHKYLVICSL